MTGPQSFQTLLTATVEHRITNVRLQTLKMFSSVRLNLHVLEHRSTWYKARVKSLWLSVTLSHTKW